MTNRTADDARFRPVPGDVATTAQPPGGFRHPHTVRVLAVADGAVAVRTYPGEVEDTWALALWSDDCGGVVSWAPARTPLDARFRPVRGDTATHQGWRRVITEVTGTERRPRIYYTLQGPDGHTFEMSTDLDGWSDDLDGARVFDAAGADVRPGRSAAGAPQGLRWEFLMDLARSVPVAEWERTHRDGVRRATLGSAYGPLFIDISMQPEIIIQIGSGPRGYHFRRGDLTPARWAMLERLADYVFECGSDVDSKLEYIFLG